MRLMKSRHGYGSRLGWWSSIGLRATPGVHMQTWPFSTERIHPMLSGHTQLRLLRYLEMSLASLSKTPVSGGNPVSMSSSLVTLSSHYNVTHSLSHRSRKIIRSKFFIRAENGGTRRFFRYASNSDSLLGNGQVMSGKTSFYRRAIWKHQALASVRQCYTAGRWHGCDIHDTSSAGRCLSMEDG
jgi:hypothetical protein